MNVGDVVRTILMRFTTEGEQKVTAALKGVQSAHEAVAKSAAHSAQVTETSARHQLSMANSMERLERRFNQTARAQFEYERVQKQVNAAVAQNPALQARANDVLARAAAHYGTASAAQGAYTRGMQLANEQAAVFASRGGAIAQGLSGLGPAGLVGAVALGTIVLGLKQVHDAAKEFAEDMGRIRDASLTLGVTTTQFQAIADAGAQLALSEEKVKTSMQRLVAQMDEFRTRSGKAFEIIDRFDPALARQISRTTDLATQIDLLGEAYAKMGAQQQTALSRALFGRGNTDVGLLIQQIRSSGGVDQLTDAFKRSGDAIDEHMIKRVAQLQRQIKDTADDARRNFASMFSEKYLEVLLASEENWRNISRIARDFKLSPDFLKFIDWQPSGSVMGYFAEIARAVPEFVTGTLGGPRGSAPTATTATAVAPENIFAEFGQLPDMKRSIEEQQLLAQAADRVVQAMRPEIDEMRKLKDSIADLDAAQSAGIQSQMRYGDSAEIVRQRLQSKLDSVEKLAAAYPGLTASEARASAGRQDQLAIAQAVTGHERMAAQERATYNRLVLEGVPPALATAQAVHERAISEAQIRANAAGQLAGLEDQHRVITATTDAEKLRAQEAARYNDLVRQGVDLGLAALIAAQERLNAEAAITAQAEKQAAAFRKATYEASQLSIELEQIAASANSFLGGSGSFLSGKPSKGGTFEKDWMADAVKNAEGIFGKGGVGNIEMGTPGFGRRGMTPPPVFSRTPNEQGLRNIADQILSKGGSLEAAIAEVSKYFKQQPGGIGAAPDEASRVLRDLFDLQTAMSGDSTQQQQGLEQQIRMLESQPKTLESLKMIRELKDSLDSLRESTDALNTTIGLDPLFTQGHGYIGIGYNPHGGRSPRIPIDPNTEPFVPSLAAPGGATGPVLNTLPVNGSMTSPGRQYIDPRTGRPIFGMADGGMFMVGGVGGVDSKYVPLRLTPGELIEVTPPRELQHYGGKQSTVVNNVTHNNTFNFPPSRSYGDRRSQRHLTEGFGRATAQAH